MDFHSNKSLDKSLGGKYEDKEKCESIRIKYFLMRKADFVRKADLSPCHALLFDSSLN